MTRSVRVKIAVGVSPEGRWYAKGYDSLRDEDAIEDVHHIARGEDDEHRFNPNVRVFWVYADLPLPDVREVEASGVEAVAQEDAR